MIVYCLVNKRNGKRYVGQTRHHDLSRRWSAGLRNSPNPHLRNAIVKYGAQAFRREILAQTLTQTEADLLERFFIFIFQSTDRHFGYNMMTGGRQGPGRHIQEVRERIRESCRKWWQRKSSAEMKRHAAISRMLWRDPVRKERMRRRVSRTLEFVWDHRSKRDKERILKNLEKQQKLGHPAWNKGKQLGTYEEAHRRAISEGLKKYWAQKKASPSLKKPVQSVPSIPDQRQAVGKASLAILKEMRRQVRHIEKTLADLHTELKGGCLW